MEPLIIQEFEMAIAHTRQSAPGLGGVPYTAWANSGPGGGGIVLMFRAYLALLNGEKAPGWFNSSPLVFIPKASPGVAGHPHAALPHQVRPISLSNIVQKVIAKAINRSLEMVAQATVHSSQRGLVSGRRMPDKLLLAQASVEKAVILGERIQGIALFDIPAALPSAGWLGIWAVLEAMMLPHWLA